MVMPLIERLARHYHTADSSKIYNAYLKDCKKQVELAKDYHSEFQREEELDKFLGLFDEPMLNMVRLYLDQTHNKNALISKSLYDEINKKKFTWDLKELESPDRVCYMKLTFPVNLDRNIVDELRPSYSNDVIVMYLKHKELFQYKIVLMEQWAGDVGEFKKEKMFVIRPGMIANEKHIFTREMGVAIDIDLIMRTVHYIQHLGKPDLRKGVNADKLNNPKKARKAARQAEYFFDHNVITLGFGKDTKYSKEKWLNKGGIRMQPYGPRDNPYYKPILIQPTVHHRKKDLLNFS